MFYFDIFITHILHRTAVNFFMKVKREQIGDEDILCVQVEYLTPELIEPWYISNSDFLTARGSALAPE